MKDKDAQTVATALTSLDGRLTMLAGALRGMLDCETLAVETYIIPPGGVLDKDWPIAFHSVAVFNHSAAFVTLVSSPSAAGTPPMQGPGIARVGAGKGAVYNLAGNALAIYGTAGDAVTIQTMAKPQPPAWG